MAAPKDSVQDTKLSLDNQAKDTEVASHHEFRDPYGLSAEEQAFLDNLPDKAKKRAISKLDWRLIPLLAFLYLMSYIDRTNIGNVKIEGIMDDIDLRGDRYNVATCIFFAPYCFFEIPSNWILSHTKRPSWYLGSLVVSWGIVMTCAGFINSYGGLLAVRFMLGLTEAGFYPGALYLIGRWYMHKEVQMRIAIFYSASAAAGAFSGLLAFGIAKLDGTAGYRGWRWIFIIEGIISVLGGIVCFFGLPDSAERSSKWLSPDEIKFLQLRKRQSARVASRSQPENSHEGESKGFPWKTLKNVLLDWQVYLLIVIYWSNAMPNYGLKFTMPSVIKGMGFTSSTAQLLTIPPYAMGTVSALVSSWIADRYTWRFPFIVFGQTLIIISYAILFAYGPTVDSRVPECYFALILACIGFLPILPSTNAWAISNLEGPTKRAIGLAWMISVGNLGGVPGSFFFKTEEAPRYPTAYASSFSVAGAGIIAAVCLELAYSRINAKRAKKSEEEIRVSYTEEQLEKMGDRSPLFRYTL
ncbi:unnamed protein product [Clonostachys rosea f. rosea IK726]|uniref:Major facilitator superfamily (MFS) profile domain-containing protein n=2 Tax=Bionectria ochroleuca TaxID=29856 RepID=A0A0B7KAQ8_BIOOC|nr:unnamed protein product [Clonostachys rosea f. rosea IK726]